MAGNKSGTFRANVGVVVLNDKWEVLALERIDKTALRQDRVIKGTGQWQMPQGGVDEGEEPDEAWRRELSEEIHVRDGDLTLIGSYPEWMVYELPLEERRKPDVQQKQGRGQVQKWYYARLKGSARIKLEPEQSGEEQEFVAHKWMPLDQLAQETWVVRRPIYERLATYLSTLRQGAPSP
jgi:putative (di)nucleoside polyphosphate hydrolase